MSQSLTRGDLEAIYTAGSEGYSRVVNCLPDIDTKPQHAHRAPCQRPENVLVEG